MATTSRPPDRAVRSDAVRNRQRLLDAAGEALIERGQDLSLEDVARRAGVGIGTLYRHFPNRQALLEAVFGSRFDALRQEGERLLASDNPPWEALRSWLRAHLAQVREYDGVPASLMLAVLADSPDVSAICATMRSVGGQLLAGAQNEDGVRRDVGIGDLMRMNSGIAMATTNLADGQALADRMLTLVLDGLRAEPAE